MAKKLSIQDVAALALPHARALAEEWFPGGDYAGDEYKPVNHVRGDRTAGSFHINVSTGEWVDFADNEARGKDLVSLYAYVTGHKQYDAAKLLYSKLTGEAVPLNPALQKAIDNETNQPISPAPLPLPRGMLVERSEPSMVFEYKTITDKLIGYVVRFDTPSGKDLYPLFCFKEGWKWRGYTGKTTKRPLYGAEKLGKTSKDVIVVVVEGEKCADVGQEKLGENYITVSWLGGTSTADKANWILLAGRQVIIWPDNDPPGLKAAKQIARATGGEIIDIPKGKPQGWDIADATPQEVRSLLAEAKRFLIKPDEADTPFNPYGENQYYKALGFMNRDDTEYYYFLNKRTNIINKITAGTLNKDRLTLLAPSSFYGDLVGYGENGSINWTKVRENVYEAMSLCGPYRPSNQRGRGVWIDGRKVVAHLGESLLVDGRMVKLGEFNSRFVYSLSEPLDIGERLLTAAEGKALLNIFSRLNWAHKSQALFLLGWLFLAPVCGALYWRPIVWLTGEAGSGKSWVMNNIISPILGDFCLDTQGGSTEAGIRQRIKNQALPVLIDEAESEDDRSRKRLQNILELARQSSSASTSVKVKGTAGGEAMEFNIASMFLFSSIKSGMVQVSDISRVVELQLLKSGNHEQFQQLQTDVDNLITADFSRAFVARAIDMVPIMRRSIKAFSAEIKKYHENARVADIFGALLGGLFALISDKIPDEQTIKEMVGMCPWVHLNQTAETTDHEEALAHLLETQIRVNTGGQTREVNISELVAQAAIGLGAANDDLSRIGLRVNRNRELQISNNHSSLKKIFKDTPWGIRWNQTFRNFKGALRHDRPLYFGKGQPQQRGYTIPLSHCNLGGEFEEGEPPPAPVPF